MVAYSYSCSTGTVTGADRYTYYSDNLVSGLIGVPGDTGEAGATGPTGASVQRIIAPRRINPVNRVFQMNRINRWLSLLRENNSRRG